MGEHVDPHGAQHALAGVRHQKKLETSQQRADNEHGGDEQDESAQAGDVLGGGRLWVRDGVPAGRRRRHKIAIHCLAHQVRHRYLQKRADDDQHGHGNQDVPVTPEIRPEAAQRLADRARFARFLLKQPILATEHHRPPPARAISSVGVCCAATESSISCEL